MAHIIGPGRSNSNAGNKMLAKMFREHTIKSIKAIGTRRKATHRARRSDCGSKRK